MIATQAKRMAAIAAVVAVGGGGSTALAVASHHHTHHGIPQHNRGDHDSDNNGGPSDGDGRV
jgi:hypothetical protein